MVDFDNALNRFRDIFDRSKILESPGLKNILIVLDETEDREEFIFQLIKQLHERWGSMANFTFLLAVRGYLDQAKEAQIELKTLSNLLEKVKREFKGEDELFDVAFFPDEEKSPYYRIKEIIDQRKIDFIIIPVAAGNYKDRIGDGLAAKTGPGGAEGNGNIVTVASFDNLRNFCFRIRFDHDFGYQAIETGIGSIGKGSQGIRDQSYFGYHMLQVFYEFLIFFR